MRSWTLGIAAATVFALGAAANWPQWRGPRLDGTNPSAHDLPVSWSETENVVWRTKLPSWAAATPIIWGDTVLITSAEEGFQGHKGSDQDGQGGNDGILLLALDRKDGSVRWSRKLGDGNRMGNKQNMASPSPVTDGESVWTMTGTGLLARWDFKGEKKWERNIPADFGKFGLQFGYGSSPLLHQGKLYVQVLHGFHTDEHSYLVALDGATGETLWKVDRPTDALHETPDSYSTAVVAEIQGSTQLIVAGGGYLTGHDLATGRELWRRGGLDPDKAPNYRTIASALVVDDMVFAPSRKKPFIAFRSSDGVTEVWRTDYGPDVPTPTSDGERLYIIDDRGIALSLRVADGETVWERQRVEPGIYSASPLLADGKIYAVNEDGATTVLKAGDEFEILSVNKLNDYTLASPVAVDDQIFIRTSNYIYCIARGGAGAGD